MPKAFRMACVICAAECVLTASAALAAVSATGDVEPPYPLTWTTSTTAYIGKTAEGSVTVDGGSDIVSDDGYLGYQVGSIGSLTVDGAGSTWTNSSWIHVGLHGSGTLNIVGGGAVTVGEDIWVGRCEGSTGTIHFDNGTLTTGGLTADFSDLTGAGTINAAGLVSDIDLVFDASHGLQQTLTLNGEPNQNISLHLDLSSDPSGNGSLGAGYRGNGTLRVADGVSVSSSRGFIGFRSGSSGVVTVDGAGSTWTDSGGLWVGAGGSATLSIVGGGAVSSSAGYIGDESGSTGSVTVDGAGSTWTNGSWLYVGRYGSGALDIVGGGAVSSSLGWIGSSSGPTGSVTVEGMGSAWTNSGGLLVRNGALSIASGGAVTVGGATSLGSSSSTGTIHFDNGTLTTGGLVAGLSELTGAGTINARGLVSDVDLVFDVSHGLQQTVTLNGEPNQNISLHLDLSSDPNSNGPLGAGCRGSGTLLIADGVSVRSSEGHIGYGCGSTGAGTVEGAGSTWTNTASLCVGYCGQGTLRIASGGAVSSGGGNYTDCIGLEPGSTGSVAVEGAGSTWTCRAHLYVGRGGSGTLGIASGGAVSNHYGCIGDRAGSSGSVTVDGIGSTWTNSSRIYVGLHGSGTLNIIAGGAVSDAECDIGYYPDSTGSVTVEGPGSTWTNQYGVSVGPRGSGVLSIVSGGAVSNRTGYVGRYSGSTGSVTVDGAGSTWTNNGDLYVGGSSSDAGGTGTLTVSDGGLVTADSATIWQTGSLAGSGGTIQASVTNHGLISPGGSVGLLTVDGSIAFGTDSTVQIDWAGPGGRPGVDYDQLVVLGSAGLAGTLELALLGGFVPARQGDAVASPDYLDAADIMVFAARDGVFETVDGMMIAPDLALAVTYRDTAVTVTAARPGNVNLDDRVNVGDLGILGANYKQTGKDWCDGDLNGDGIVNVADLGILGANYGWTAGGAAVPEPATAVVFLLGGVAFLRRRRLSGKR